MRGTNSGRIAKLSHRTSNGCPAPRSRGPVGARLTRVTLEASSSPSSVKTRSYSSAYPGVRRHILRLPFREGEVVASRRSTFCPAGLFTTQSTIAKQPGRTRRGVREADLPARNAPVRRASIADGGDKSLRLARSTDGCNVGRCRSKKCKSTPPIALASCQLLRRALFHWQESSCGILPSFA